MSFGFQVHGSEYLHSHETTFPIHSFGPRPDSSSTEPPPINGQDPIPNSLPMVSSAVDVSRVALGDLITTISKPDRATSSSTEPLINGQDPIPNSLPTVSSAVDVSREALGDLITTISELYEEHVPAVVNVRMRFNKPADLVKLQRGEKVATITSLHGIDVTVEELSKKLERFKVRTIEVGGVVKEGINRQACIEIDSPGSRWFIHSA